MKHLESSKIGSGQIFLHWNNLGCMIMEQHARTTCESRILIISKTVYKLIYYLKTFGRRKLDHMSKIHEFASLAESANVSDSDLFRQRS